MIGVYAAPRPRGLDVPNGIDLGREYEVFSSVFLECSRGGADKFYDLYLLRVFGSEKPYWLYAVWGRICGPGTGCAIKARGSSAQYDSLWTRRARLVEEKLAKGYSIGGSFSGYVAPEAAGAVSDMRAKPADAPSPALPRRLGRFALILKDG